MSPLTDVRNAVMPDDRIAAATVVPSSTEIRSPFIVSVINVRSLSSKEDTGRWVSPWAVQAFRPPKAVPCLERSLSRGLRDRRRRRHYQIQGPFRCRANCRESRAACLSKRERQPDPAISAYTRMLSQSFGSRSPDRRPGLRHQIGATNRSAFGRCFAAEC